MFLFFRIFYFSVVDKLKSNDEEISSQDIRHENVTNENLSLNPDMKNDPKSSDDDLDSQNGKNENDKETSSSNQDMINKPIIKNDLDISGKNQVSDKLEDEIKNLISEIFADSDVICVEKIIINICQCSSNNDCKCMNGEDCKCTDCQCSSDIKPTSDKEISSCGDEFNHCSDESEHLSNEERLNPVKSYLKSLVEVVPFENNSDLKRSDNDSKNNLNGFNVTICYKILFEDIKTELSKEELQEEFNLMADFVNKRCSDVNLRIENVNVVQV